MERGLLEFAMQYKNKGLVEKDITEALTGFRFLRDHCLSKEDAEGIVKDGYNTINIETDKGEILHFRFSLIPLLSGQIDKSLVGVEADVPIYVQCQIEESSGESLPYETSFEIFNMMIKYMDSQQE